MIETEACWDPSFGPLEGTVGLLEGLSEGNVWVVDPCSLLEAVCITVVVRPTLFVVGTAA